MTKQRKSDFENGLLSLFVAYVHFACKYMKSFIKGGITHQVNFTVCGNLSD